MPRPPKTPQRPSLAVLHPNLRAHAYAALANRDALAAHLLAAHPDKVTPWSAWSEPTLQLTARHQRAHGATRDPRRHLRLLP